MVASMSRGKKAYLQYEAQLSAAIARLEPLREELKAAVDADAEAYDCGDEGLQAGEELIRAATEALIDAALKLATDVPLGVAEKAQ